MATRPSPDETATLILDAVVEGRYGMRPGNVLGVMAIRATASNHDVHLDDFGPGLVRASENGWFEQTGPYALIVLELIPHRSQAVRHQEIETAVRIVTKADPPHLFKGRAELGHVTRSRCAMHGLVSVPTKHEERGRLFVRRRLLSATESR